MPQDFVLRNDSTESKGLHYISTALVMKTEKIKKILVVMLGGIGDMILLTPALKALRKEFPESHLALLSEPDGAKEVVEGSRLVDEIILRDKGFFKLLGSLRRKRFDSVIAATGMNPVKTGLLALFIGAKHRLGEDIKGKGYFYNLKINYDENLHEVEGNIRLVERLGLKVEDKSLFIRITEEDKESASNFLRSQNIKEDNLLYGISKLPPPISGGSTPLEGVLIPPDGGEGCDLIIGIHPGSGIFQAGFRRWAPERFARVADRLIKTYNAQVIIFGGKQEISLAERVASLMKKNPIIAAGKTTLGETAALIERCNLFITNDSGLMHIACAVKTPVVAIFGPTDYRKTGPYSINSAIIRKNLPCSPCYQRGKVKCKELDCFKLITVEEVLEAAERVLGKIVG